MTSKGSFWTVTSLTQCRLSMVRLEKRTIYKITRVLAQVEGSMDILQQQSQNTKAKISEVMEDLIAVLRDCQASLVGVVEHLEGKASKEL